MESIFIKDQDEIWFHLLSILTPNALHTDAIYSFYSTPHTVAGLGTAWENEPAKTDETEPEKPQKGKHGP